MKRSIGPRSKPKSSQRSDKGVVGPGKGYRHVSVKVKTAKRRTLASTQWLERQLNDPYVAESKRLGYRGRAAFKLIELEEKLSFLQPASRVVDFGCAPGGWLQVLAAKCPRGQIVGIDLQDTEPVAGTITLVGDVRNPEDLERVRAILQGPADAVLSDMAAASTGHSQTDYLRVMNLIALSFDFAQSVLRPGGLFLVKTLRGGSDSDLLNQIKQVFAKVRHMKPKASRDDSKETFLVATGFRPRNSPSP